MIMKFKYYISVVVYLLVTISVNAQDAGSLKKLGDKFFKLEQYHKALPFYEQILKADSSNADVIFKAGVCYLHQYSKEKSLNLMLKASSMNYHNKYMHLWLGRAYHQNYQFNKAIDEYNDYKNSLPKTDQQRHKEVDKYIIQTNNARKFISSPQNFIIKNLGANINTQYSEHSPVVSKLDTLLLFTSRRDNVTGGKEDADGDYFEDIFQSRRSSDVDTAWGKPVKFGENTANHDASIQLYDNDTKMLLYKNTHQGDIYTCSKQSNGTWSIPVRFANINTPDYESDAYITPDGNTVYYATNHYKKKGDLDIYYITREKDSSWSKPKELPGRINTMEDEDAPFLSPDGKILYFCSRGHKNMGGYDVFKSTKDSSGNWKDPVNMGYPLNTPDDDVYFYLSSDGIKSYLSSYREGGYGEKDIYVAIPFYSTTVKGKLISTITNSNLDSCAIIFKPTKSKALNSKMESANAAQGSYNADLLSATKYDVTVVRGKDTIHHEVYEIPMLASEGTSLTKDFYINYTPPKKEVPVVVPEVVIMKNDSNETLPEFNNIYFEVEQANLNKAGEEELKKVIHFIKNSHYKLEIHGYASEEGSKTLNQKLSDQRSKAVYDYTLKNGLAKKQVLYKGLGDTNPVADNTTEEGRRLNRRVELKIIK